MYEVLGNQKNKTKKKAQNGNFHTWRKAQIKKIKQKTNYYFSSQSPWKHFYLLLATHLCEVCVQCLLVLYASVHEVCGNIYLYIFIYNANTSKSKYIYT